MQLKLKFSFALFLALSVYASAAVAQEEGQSVSGIQELNSHPDLNLNEDKTLIQDVDAKASKAQPGNKETNNTISNANKPKADAQKTADKSEEDPLSFNFLYFIIQKFKISDIVDD
jgi:negative regulator of genetic competence, sporulation and motility